MDELWKVLVLAVVQGVTEFLPISSSGHLVIVAKWLSPEATEVADLNVALHVGTLGSIVLYYARDLWRLRRESWRSLGLLVVATIPAGVIGVALELSGVTWLESPLLAGCMLLVTGVVLLTTARGAGGTGDWQGLSWRQATTIGACQAAAILPGLSRSGTTITAGLRCGLSGESAATFSFFMAVPVIAGAGLLKALLNLRDRTGIEPAMPGSWLVLGAAVSFAVGLVSLAWLIRWLRRGRLHLFAAWCFLAGLVVIASHAGAWTLARSHPDTGHSFTAQP